MSKRGTRGALLTIVVLLSGLPALAFATEPVRLALVVGNNRPIDGDVDSLRYADDDALSALELLKQAGVTTFALVTADAETRQVHPDFKPFGAPRNADFERASQHIRQQLAWARSQGRATEFLFVYSGHGDVENGEGVLALEDGRLTRSTLYALLSSLHAERMHVIIDACKSYFMAYERGPGGKRVRFAGAVTASVPSALKNVGFILSTSSDRETHEWERYRAGILSHELQSALRGAADINGDSTISYRELASFLRTANMGIVNPRFRPDFMVRAPEDDFSVGVLSWPTSQTLEINADGWDHFYIETAQGDRVLDAHPGSGQTLRLHLPAELPLFVHRHDGQGERVISEPGALQVGAPKPSTLEVAVRDGAAGRAYQKLFSVPFGARELKMFAEDAILHVDLADAHILEPRFSTLRLGTGILALSAAVAGISLSGVVLVERMNYAHAAQLAIDHANDRITTLNRISLACYGAAVLAGIAWVWGPWWRNQNLQLSAAPVLEGARRGGLALQVQALF